MLAESIEDGEHNVVAFADYAGLTPQQVRHKLEMGSIEGCYEAHSAQILADERLAAQLGSKIRKDPLLDVFVRHLLAEGESDREIHERAKEGEFTFIPNCQLIANFRRYVARFGPAVHDENMVAQDPDPAEPAPRLEIDEHAEVAPQQEVEGGIIPVRGFEGPLAARGVAEEAQGIQVAGLVVLVPVFCAPTERVFFVVREILRDPHRLSTKVYSRTVSAQPNFIISSIYPGGHPVSNLTSCILLRTHHHPWHTQAGPQRHRQPRISYSQRAPPLCFESTRVEPQSPRADSTERR